MSQNPPEYYMFFEDWKLDPNQWGVLLDSLAVFFTILGFLIAFIMYGKQRRDKAKDAFDFFQSSLPELKKSIICIIDDLNEFYKALDLDNSVNPVISSSLKDNFLNKINLVDLNRYYRKYRKDQLKVFKDFLVDSNFFSDYHSFISKEINYFRDAYQKEQRTFSKWQLLRSKRFFTKNLNESKNLKYEEFYDQWVDNFTADERIFQIDEKGRPFKIKDQKKLVEDKIKALARDIFPFIESSEKANEVNMIANNVINAYSEMAEMKIKIKKVIETDKKKFENILQNLNNLLED